MEDTRMPDKAYVRGRLNAQSGTFFGPGRYYDAPWELNLDTLTDVVAELIGEVEDYRALLKRYIQHVGDCEGVDFLSDVHRTNWSGTEGEWNALQSLGDEVTDEQRAQR